MAYVDVRLKVGVRMPVVDGKVLTDKALMQLVKDAVDAKLKDLGDRGEVTSVRLVFKMSNFIEATE